MAKGIGNGFPLAALVTTPEIAASYAQALHFNTFGGNPMASAVGSAVLDVSYMSNTVLHSKVLEISQQLVVIHSFNSFSVIPQHKHKKWDTNRTLWQSNTR